jgi:hypothetical protein
MKEVTDLIDVVVKLLWPILSFAAVLIFRPQIVEMIGRLRKRKFFGQEIELCDSLNRLSESTAKVEEKAASEPQAIAIGTSEAIGVDDQIWIIMDEASKSAKTGLIMLASQIEREMRQLLASIGLLGGRKNVGFSQALDELNAQYGGLPGFIPAAYKNFIEARNLIVHGGAAKDEDILGAINSGMTIVKAIRSLPHEVHVVYRYGVDLYKDVYCLHLYDDVKGVILENQSPGSTTKSHSIYLITKNHCQNIKPVAWEWSGEKKWGPAWYCDPDTSEAKQA